MKRCKAFFLLATLTLAFTIHACFIKYKPYRFEISESTVELEYGRAMDQALLDSIVLVLKAQNIELKHIDLVFDGMVLSKLTFEINYGNQKAQASTNFVNKGFGFGFSVNKANGAVQVGEIFK
ncbi:MAG: hypothetical protein IPM48_12865 [Saprospiraceae bacterium]|nr:hypothetical protein [Saprospiraceae bacterium]